MSFITPPPPPVQDPRFDEWQVMFWKWVQGSIANQGGSGIGSGGISIASLNGGQLAGFRNRIINGDCRVQQRAAATLTAAYQYGMADRTMIGIIGGSSISGNTGIGTGATTSSGYMTGTTSGSWTTGQFAWQHRINALNTYDLNSKQLTVSCVLYQTTGASRNFKIALYKPTTTINTFSALTLLQTSAALAVSTSTYTRVSATLTAIGAAEASLGLMVLVYDDTANTVSTKSYLMGDLQIEIGAAATPFEERPYTVEDLLCRSYYRVFGKSIGGWSYSTTQALMYFTFEPPMIGTPTMAMSTTTPVLVEYSSGLHTGTSSTAATYNTAPTANGGIEIIDGFTSLTVGRPCAMDQNFLSASAEL